MCYCINKYDKNGEDEPMTIKVNILKLYVKTKK